MCDLDGYNEVWNSKQVRARKEHACCACNGKIPAGIYYHASSALFDGSWSRYKHCIRCYEMLEAICARARSPVDVYLNCGSSWEDAFDEETPDYVAELAFVLPHELQPSTPPTP